MTETVEDLSNSLLSIENVTTRYVDPNHWNYTEDQKAIKKKAMKAVRFQFCFLG